MKVRQGHFQKGSDTVNLIDTQKKRKNRLPVLFILICVLPAIVLAITFIYIPTIRAIELSFRDVGLLSLKGKFVGFENFAYLFKDKYFTQALVNTLKVIVAVPFVTIFTAFLFAFIIQQSNLKEKKLYITIYFLPSVISSTVLAIIWSYVFHPTSGTLNNILGAIGLSALKHTWLGESTTALWCIALTIYLTSFGYYMVMHMSGLDSISPEIYESATLDGAGFWKKLFRITMPLMRNIIGITFVINMSGVLGASYTYSMLMTNGSPNGASNVLLRYIYQQGMTNGNMGYSSAISVFTLALGVILSLISRRLTSKEG